MIVLGSYNLNVEDMTLSSNVNEFVLEPKVFEVLLYLCNNPDRFISMNELHDNVWQGRCVSDAAVRRTISKLRIIFNDDHKIPLYIKSLPKRGYKLICQISSQPLPPNSARLDVDKNSSPQTTSLPFANATFNTENDITSSIASDNISSKFTLRNSQNSRRIIALLLFCIFVYILVIFLSNNDGIDSQVLTQPDQKINHEVIKTLPGVKIAIAQSSDNEFLAFSGQVNQYSGYQIYLKRSVEENFTPITKHAFFPIGLAFSRDNKQLFYSDLKQGGSSLHSISLAGELSGEIETIVDNFFKIGDVFTSLETNYVYFSGQKSITQPRYIYRYDLKTHDVIKVTSSSQIDYVDIKGAISPNGRLMAVLRYTNQENSADIRVIDLLNDNVIFKYYQDQIIYDIQWKSNEQLIVLDNDKLYSLDCNDKANVKLLETTPNLTAFIVDDTEQFIGLSMPTYIDKRLFIEQALPFNNWVTNHIYTSPSGSYFLGSQPNNDSKLILSYNDDITSMSQLNTKSNQITPLIQTEYSLSVLASSPNKLELIKLNKRFALYNTETLALTYISSGDDNTGDATFSSDQKNILFSLKNYNGWEIFTYNIDSQITEKLLSEYRYIRAYGDNYILATSNGWLFLYNIMSKDRIALNHQLSDEPNTRWDVTSHYIYWSSHNLVQTVLHQLDISDINNPVASVKTFNYNEIRPDFNIDHSNFSLIYRQRDKNNSELIRL
ncbi:hypothetical protein G3495_21510 [Shewanella baltica]|uniref:winged helix-turn-helix domain-containing protein n=1 Tax=Shewanella baltica TaxID=62322 RepID=UPI00217D0F7D|nr:winged helix-turn-helix domain-containing protein [Shewanella baltica]MCS6237663.1 hypothetical protein [Shewanella baltica]MCS6272208.1 hypothetical protein [Shewanella baltica]